jgi:hypothetical protein
MRGHILLYNFRPDDRLAVLCKRNRVQQRIVTADELIKPRFQSWLKEQNGGGANIHVSMNTLKPEATGRTKNDIADIRHIYLDIDHSGQDALARLMADAPPPSCILTTSPGRYQVIWKAEGFSHAEAEALQRAMAVKYGADRAAIDVSRVLRIPGFTNLKYDPPYLVTAEKISERICRPADFRIERMYENTFARNPVNPGNAGTNTRSHRDWHEVCKRLERGEHPADVQAWLETEAKQRGKSPQYAKRTVRLAVIHVEQQQAAREAQRAAIKAASSNGKTHQMSRQENIMKSTEKKKASETQIAERAGAGKKEFSDGKTQMPKQEENTEKKKDKEYIIGGAPRTVIADIKELSDQAKERNEPGMQWTYKNGWLTTNISPITLSSCARSTNSMFLFCISSETSISDMPRLNCESSICETFSNDTTPIRNGFADAAPENAKVTANTANTRQNNLFFFCFMFLGYFIPIIG